MLICLLSGANVSAQNIVIREASGSGATNVWSALKYIAENTVIPDANGVVHLDLSGDITEPEGFTEGSATFTFPAAVKKIVISSTSATRHTITNPISTASEATKNAIYKLRFADKAGELEIKNVTFAGAEGSESPCFGWVASSTSTDSDVTSKTYIHDCTFNEGYELGGRDCVTPAEQPQTFQFENNTFNYGTFYIFHVSADYRPNENFFFKNNELYNFRGISLFPKITTPINVTCENNYFYRQQAFPESFGGTSVTLCQVTGTINGNWTFIGNRALGLFTAKDVPSKQKTCALLLNHAGEYSRRGIGIADGSNITVKDNLLQCDVYTIGTKAGTGSSFVTHDITEEVIAHTYYDNVPGQTGNYTATVSGNKIVHMYPKDSATHDDDDACHICEACGQVVIRAEVSGHGGTFQYEGEDHQMHDVNSAVATIAMNLYPTDIAAGVDLYQKIVRNITRDGFCLDPKKSQEFVITPTLPGAFKALKFYGYAAPVDVTSQASTSDGGKTYRYTLTNNYTHSNPYIVCPVLIASITFGSITVKCNGLEKNDCALFLVEGEDGTKFWVNLSGVHPSKTISGLKPGSYTVKPHNTSSLNWQWTYTMTPSSSTVETVAADELVTVTYSVTKKSVTVKHGENYKDNELEGSSAPDSINSWKKKGSYDL